MDFSFVFIGIGVFSFVFILGFIFRKKSDNRAFLERDRLICNRIEQDCVRVNKCGHIHKPYSGGSDWSNLCKDCGEEF